jgi:hypothetical protein
VKASRQGSGDDELGHGAANQCALNNYSIIIGSTPDPGNPLLAIPHPTGAYGI